MNFHTKVTIPDPPVRLGYQTPALFMGSCFSDYIGTIMSGYKFPLLMNPFGTLFNPASIAANIENLVKRKEYKPDDLNFHDGLWLSFDHYTGFSGPDEKKCLNRMNAYVFRASEWLKNSKFLVITFGTAWIYRYRNTGRIVANCHKIPQSAFSRELLQPSDITAAYNGLLSSLAVYNPSLKIIFTVSPVRHWADGAVNNQLSKSVLHYSIQEILKEWGNAWYFPSYEIFMDELRDYRFYAADMLHPSEQGSRYVWERFLDSWFEESSKRILTELEPVLTAVRHRPTDAGSEAHRKFSEKMLAKTENLKTKYPFIDLSEEIAFFKS